MSGILNKLGLGHSHNNTNDVAHEAGHNHTSAVEHAEGAGKTTTTTTTTTNNNDLNRGINNSSLQSSNLHSSNINSTGMNSSLHTSDNMAARTGAAYTGATTATTAQQQGLFTQQNRLSGDDAMTRSEEQLRVAKATVETGKAELNKTVSVEHVEKAVPVSRERVVIEREPITQSNLPAALNGPAISEAHYETTLKEDRVAAVKETVPIERIRLAKQVETSVESVGADLRKEHIDLTMQNADNKLDTTSSNYMAGRSGALASDKIDTHTRSGLMNENASLHNSSINSTANSRNI